MMGLTRVAAQLCIIGFLCLGSVSVYASAIFEDKAVNIWLVDTQTQAVTTYSFGAWVDSHQNLQSFPANAPFQVLVNGLAQSSEPMSPLQSSISIIGLDEADLSSQTNSGPVSLTMLPQTSTSNQTIEVQLQVNADTVAQGDITLRWQINGGVLNAVSLSPFELPDANGLISKRFYLIADGTYNVVAQVYQFGQLLDERNNTYTISSSSSLGEKRDTDSDGIPDLVEDELGLNPLSADAFTDFDNNGWSRFDEWLRCSDLQVSNCSTPIDSDGDGWSDFDEQLRGTRYDDFQLKLAQGEQATQAFNKQKLSLQEKPAARRLYEVEYVFNSTNSDLGLDKVITLEAAELDGTALFNLNQLVTNQDLELLGVDSAALSPNILLASAQQNLEKREWPNLRLAAANSLAIRATTEVAAQQDPQAENSKSKLVSLLVLKAAGDIDIRDFPSNALGDWANVEDWRRLYIEWLKTQVVKPINVSFSPNSTIAGLLFEASLREEAVLAGDKASVLLGKEARPRNWLAGLNQDMVLREDTRLYDWYQRILNNVLSQSSYTQLLAQAKEFLSNLPVSGTNSSEWLNQRLAMPVVLADQGCFITTADLAEIQSDGDFFAQYQQQCPVFYTEVELAQWQEQAIENRYLLRMTIFDQGPANIAATASLALYDDDTDTDNQTNAEEVLARPYTTSTYPWLADSDGDQISDDIDECVLDPLNLCAGNHNPPTLITGADISVNVTGQGGLALLELVLTTPAINPVSFSYAIEADTGLGDSAVDGVDFVANSNTVSFAPGQQSVIIPVNLLNNELAGQRGFRVRFFDVEGASIQGDDNTQLVSVISSGQSAPTIELSANTFTVNERAVVAFDATASDSGISDPTLNYTWQQNTGPSVVLTNPNTATPSFTAPETQSVINLEFTLTAQNSDGTEANAKVLVAVNPVDDPPVIIGTASYSVDRGERVSIPKTDLLALVNEPDGELLTLNVAVQVVAGGELIVTADSIDFEASNEGLRKPIELEKNPLDIRSWQQDGLVYRTAQTDLDPSIYTIHTWSPQQGSQIVDQGNQSYSGILTSPSQDVIYYSRFDSDTGSTWIEWMNEDNSLAQVDTGGFGSLFGAQINPENGILYHCKDDIWQRIDPKEGTNTTLSLSCERFSAAQAQVDGKFCLSGAGGLHCTDDGFTFEQVFSYVDDFSELYGVYSSDAGTIVMYHDYLNLFIVHVDGSTNGNVLYTLDDYFASVSGYWIEDTFYTLLPVNGANFEQGAQLFKWQVGDAELLGLGDADLFTGNITRFNHNDFIPFGDDFLWIAQDQFDIYKKYSINVTTGEFAQIDEDFTESISLVNWQDKVLQSTATTEQGCDWFVLDAEGSLPQGTEPELDDTGCFGRIVYGSSLIDRNYNSNTDETDFSVIPGGGGTSQTQFIVTIQDENGNSVELVVSIAIEQGAD